MSMNVGLERCFAFINCQLNPGGKATYVAETDSRRFITISRQGGCGAHAVAEKLAERLQARTPPDSCPWAIFDRNLVEKVLDDHHLPKRFEKYMPEDRNLEIADVMEELFDLHPSSWTLVHKTCESILRVAQLGRCIFIGRGADLITDRLEHGFHVRLVGSVEIRIERMMSLTGLDRPAAEARIAEQDRARRRFVKKYFDEDIDNPLLYELVINTDHFSLDEVARLIAEAAFAPHVHGKISATPAVSA